MSIFNEVNDFVFDTDRHFEELQSKCLELASELERKDEEIQRLMYEVERYKRLFKESERQREAVALLLNKQGLKYEQA